MAHKTKIGDAYYEISGGKTKIGDANYGIEFIPIITMTNGPFEIANPIAQVKTKDDGSKVPNGRNRFPVGTVLNCYVGVATKTSYAGKLIINGNVVLTVPSPASSYINYSNEIFEYTVTRSATITCEVIDENGDGTKDYGIVTITEH